MKKWEIRLRKKLHEELSDGPYIIISGNIKLHTGKGGYIEYKVMIEKDRRKHRDKLDQKDSRLSYEDADTLEFREAMISCFFNEN